VTAFCAKLSSLKTHLRVLSLRRKEKSKQERRGSCGCVGCVGEAERGGRKEGGVL
jgi:hypothetical protein